MNKKSIFSIFLILLALSLTLGAVSAEDVAGDSAVSADESTAVSADESVDAVATTDAESADLEVSVDYSTEVVEGEVFWGVYVVNNGPDTAVNTNVLVNYPDSLLLIDYYEFGGTYDPYTGLWTVGDMTQDEGAVLLLETKIIGDGPYFVEALAYSETPDPYIYNNYDIVVLDVEDASAAEETLPAAGNPIAMVLLALLAVGVGGLRRRL